MVENIISGLRGFTFNGKHNKDLKVVMESKSIQPPSKKKIKETVPFMNGSYDFSTIGSNGEQIYSERDITIVLGLPASTKEELQVIYSDVLEWLEDVGKQQLKFDVINDYYYMAEVEESSSFEEVMEFGKLTVKFTADPFKMSVDYVGSDVWDTFNFEEDYSQNNEFVITNTTAVSVYNPKRPVNPIINCTNAMTLSKNGTTYNLNTGDNKLYGFRLNTGTNDMVINGTGIIKFLFRKESL